MTIGKQRDIKMPLSFNASNPILKIYPREIVQQKLDSRFTKITIHNNNSPPTFIEYLLHVRHHFKHFAINSFNPGINEIIHYYDTYIKMKKLKYR